METSTKPLKNIETKNQPPSKAEFQLWAALKEGNITALGSLYDLFINELFSYGMRYSKDRGYVMDCIHDLYFDLYKYRSKLTMTDNVKSYLLKSLQRKINKKYARKVVPVQDDYSLMINGLHTNHIASVEEEIIRTEKAAETSSKLANALKTLTKKQRKGLFLRFNQDRSYEEIAEIMKTSIPSARTNIYRALKLVRKQPLSLFILLHSYFFS